MIGYIVSLIKKSSRSSRKKDRLSYLFDEVQKLSTSSPNGEKLRHKFFVGIGALSANCLSPRLLHPDFGRVVVKKFGDSRLIIKLKGTRKCLSIPFIADIARQYQF